MKITWAIEGRGAGSADVVDVDQAARALGAAVRAAYAKDGPSVQVHVLTAVVGRLRASLVTDGRWAVEHGDEWAKAVAGIFVTLSP